MATSVKPVALKERDARRITSWRAVKSTSRYQVLEQREELEKWSEWKDDLLKRVRVAMRDKGERRSFAKGLNLDPATKSIEVYGPGTPTPDSTVVTIVGSP
jgi:predicted nucleotidyltransferase